MKISYIFFAIYFAIICHSFMNFIWGKNGLFAFYDLLEQRDRLNYNIEALEEKNNALVNRLQLLRSEPETLRVLARELGYYQAGEQVLRVTSFSAPVSYYELGRIVEVPAEEGERNPYFKLPVILFSIVLLTIFILADKRDEHGYKRKFPGLYPKGDNGFKKA